MSVVWKLNGSTFASLGLSGLRRELRSLAPDVVTFTASGKAFDSADLSGLALNDVVTITREVDAVSTQWFKGVVTAVPREGAPAGESLRYTLTGPWWYLDNLVYRQRFPLDATANPSIYLPGYHRRAVAVIGQDYTGARQTNIAALTDVLDWCIDAGAGFSRGTLPTGFNFPYISAIAPACSEAVRMCLKMMPDAASRFDYTATTPVLSVLRRGDADDTTIDLSAEPGLKSISITPRHDLKIDHVVIQNIAIGGTFYTVLTEDKDPSGSTGLEFGSVVVPIDANTDPIPAGLAANWRSSLSTLQYQGHIRFEETECLRAVRPGDVVNITNGLTDWETMNAQVTQVTEDVDTGSTEWVFGPPEHLSVQDLIEVLKVARLQRNAYDGPPLVAGRRKPAASGVEFDGPLGVFGDGHFFGAVRIDGSSRVDGDFRVIGDTQLDGEFNVLGNAFFAYAEIAGYDVGDSITDLLAADTALDGRLTTAEAAIVTNADAIADLASDLAALDTREAGHYTDLLAADVDILDVTDAIISDLDTVISTVNDHSTAITGLLSADTALDGRLTTAEAAIVTNADNIADVASGLATLDTREAGHYTGLLAADTALDGRLTTAEAAIVTNADAIADVASDLATLDTREAGHYTELLAADVDILDVTDAIISDLETVISTVNDHSTAITALDGRLDTIEALLSGKTSVTLTVCDSGVVRTTTVVGTTPA